MGRQSWSSRLIRAQGEDSRGEWRRADGARNARRADARRPLEHARLIGVSCQSLNANPMSTLHLRQTNDSVSCSGGKPSVEPGPHGAYRKGAGHQTCPQCGHRARVYPSRYITPCDTRNIRAPTHQPMLTPIMIEAIVATEPIRGATHFIKRAARIARLMWGSSLGSGLTGRSIRANDAARAGRARDVRFVN
jgi:hypothetical protein